MAWQTPRSVRCHQFRHRELVLEVRRQLSQLQALATEGKWLGDQCQAIRVRAGLIDQVPCNAQTDLQPHCQLLKDAMTARDSLPATEGLRHGQAQPVHQFARTRQAGYGRDRVAGRPAGRHHDRAEAERSRLNERIHVLAALAGEAGRLTKADRRSHPDRAGWAGGTDRAVADKQAAIEKRAVGCGHQGI